MNILIAMNSFKGSLSAVEASHIVQDALRTLPYASTSHAVPLVDGGTGSLEAWSAIMGIEPHYVPTVNALGMPLKAPILIREGIGYIEMASASGLHLLNPDNLNIESATTYGTGLLLKAAYKEGCRKIYLGIGGSATHDLGTGILRALGVRFLDYMGQELTTPNELLDLATIDCSQLISNATEVELIILCDVDNSLLGERGAAQTYAPQKGATTATLLKQCEKLSETFAEYYLSNGVHIGNESGDGAAGGIPALLRPILKAKVMSGADFTVEIADIKNKIIEADLVITGEGQFDEQSFYGKGPGTIIHLCQAEHKPVLILTGGYRNIPDQLPGCSIFAIAPYPTNLKDALLNASPWLKQEAFNAVKLFMMGMHSQN